MNNILSFADRKSFRIWLSNNGYKSNGVWLIFGKRGGPLTLTANDALEEALCHGWIDGQMQSIDDTCYRKYFARRINKSKWSEKNKRLALSLIERGLMKSEGLQAIERAKQNGTWDKNSRIIIEDDQIKEFIKLVEPFENAYNNLMAMSQSIHRTYTGYYFDAKSDQTRINRLTKIVDRLNQNLKPM